MIAPSKKDFLQLLKEGKTPPLYKEISYLPPYLIYESLASKDSFLFESIKGPWKIARYSFIGFDPYLTFKVKNGFMEIVTEGKAVTGGNERSSGQRSISLSRPLDVLKALVKSYRQMPFEYLPPFQGGAAGILSYDFVRYFEQIPKNAADDLKLPDAHFLMIDKLIAFDHLQRKCWVIVCPGARDKVRVDWLEKYDEAEYEIEKILKKVGNISSLTLHGCNFKTPDLRPKRNTEIIYEMKKNDYIDIVKKAKEYIAAGDIFQANLSQRVSANIKDKSPWSLYRTLRLINPSPFAAFIDFGDYKIVSSSPERLLRVKDGTIETRPIAGTRPRGKDSNEDELMRKELLLNEKERAEHIMLIDLERNDLGKVSEYGSVCVDEFMITEDYSHVIHIVSNVTGRLGKGKDCFDAIRAVFPGGTVTGVPKVRCMEIIDELEPVSRGPYTGSIGYIGFSGNMDLDIVIRTFVIKGEMAYIQAGAGIVADSDPEMEYYETLKKAEALIKTLKGI